MIGTLLSFAVGGATGYIIKDKLSSGDNNQSKNRTEINEIFSENEKIARRNKELERENEDLLAEIAKLRRQANEQDVDSDAMEDALDSAKREIKT